jgi:hypothetical protein
VASVKGEGSTLFGFSENFSPHNFSRAVKNLKVAIGNFIANEKVATFMCLVRLELESDPLTLR